MSQKEFGSRTLIFPLFIHIKLLVIVSHNNCFFFPLCLIICLLFNLNQYIFPIHLCIFAQSKKKKKENSHPLSINYLMLLSQYILPILLHDLLEGCSVWVIIFSYTPNNRDSVKYCSLSIYLFCSLWICFVGQKWDWGRLQDNRLKQYYLFNISVSLPHSIQERWWKLQKSYTCSSFNKWIIIIYLAFCSGSQWENGVCFTNFCLTSDLQECNSLC